MTSGVKSFVRLRVRKVVSGKTRTRPPDPEVAGWLRSLRDQKRLTVDAMAGALGELGGYEVKPRMLSRYLRELTPVPADLVAAACRAWKTPFEPDTNGTGPRQARSTAVVQLELFDAPQLLPNGDVVVKLGVARAGSPLESPKLTVEIKFAS